MLIENKPFLEVEELHKRFSHVEALRGATLNAYQRQILAIVGDNGAGKSTLIKALSGVLTPDSGTISIQGKEYNRLTPRLARECGIAAVFQDLSLINSQNVWENIFLGQEYHRKGWLNCNQMRREATRLLESLNIDIKNIDVPVGNLSGGQRQALAIARAIRQGRKLVIFDEPTAAMGYRETLAVQKLIKELTKQGLGIIVISHNIQQVFELADRICVMRQGIVQGIVQTKAVTMDDIVAMIMGSTNTNVDNRKNNK
jgi:ABC-type sugar transport system ATPase subunit